MTAKLFWDAIAKLLLGLLLMGALLFGPAATWNYPNAWLLLGLLFIPMFIAGVVLMLKNPALLQKRLNVKEQESQQKLVIVLSSLLFVTGFVLSALDFRFGWSRLPQAVSYVAGGVFLLAYLIYAEVLRENAYLSRTVEVQENQQVVDTGLYGIVRHPMYSGITLLFLSMPLVLGSLVALCVFLLFPPVLVKRIRNEEQVLANGLKGYREYMQKVKYRLIPFVW